MRRLAGEDTQFIFQETRVQHQHTMKVVVIDPEGGHGDLTYEGFREGIRMSIPHSEPFRWKLVKVPFRMGHPWWVDAPDLDIDYHVRRATAPSPGGKRELAEVISMIASIGLERDRPLWQAWLVDGLEGGRIALVMKVHHSLADGMSSAQLLLDLLDDTPAPRSAPAPLEEVPREPMPSKGWLVRDGLVHGARIVARLPRLAATTARWGRAASRQNRRGHPLAKSFAVDKLRWNAPLTPQRWFAYETVSLSDMKRVKNEFGGSVNDVFLAMVAGGTRRYLEERGELLEVDLTASIPVSTRRPEQAREWGNRTTIWLLELATTVEDPVERLQTITARTQAARAAREERGTSLHRDYMEAWPLWTILVNWLPTPLRRLSKKSSYSLIASSVPGPKAPLYANGARVTEVISMGPLVMDLGLNVTGWSYCDDFTLGAVGCREHIPDIWDLVDHMVTALDELVARCPAVADEARA